MTHEWFYGADGRLRNGWRAAAGLLVGALLVFAVVPILTSLLVGRGGGLLFELIYRCSGALALAVAFVVLASILDGVVHDRARYIGVPLDRSAISDVLLGALVGFGMITVAVVAIAVAGDIEVRATLNLRTLARAGAVLVMTIGGAALEELLTRGYPFQRTVQAAGPVVAIVIFAAGFGLMHLGNPNANGIGVLNTALVGIVFAIAYLRTRSLWLPIGMHAAWNASLGLVYGLPVSGLNMFSVVTHTRARGPEWLTGGSYGIEASFTGTSVILLGLIATVLLTRGRETPNAAAVCGGADGHFALADERSSGIQSS